MGEVATGQTDQAPTQLTNGVVVGAGPVGLTVACALQHHGVRLRILEPRTEPNPHSKANNLRARPQELLAGIGVHDRLAERARRDSPLSEDHLPAHLPSRRPAPRAGALVLFELDEAAHTADGLRGNLMLGLERPDGHIALRAAADDVDELTGSCRRVGTA